MKITVVYDNKVLKEGLKAGWGFSAYIETEKAPPVLFDTGADSPTLLHNMVGLNINPGEIGTIVISHDHFDHTGGLSEVLRVNRTAGLYLPGSFKGTFPGRKVTMVGKEPVQIGEDVFSTGELEGIEQSLAVKTDKGVFVVTGCSHPAMSGILGAAGKFGRLYGIVGGFHDFRDFKAFDDLSLIYPCHCTQHTPEIKNLFRDRTGECGAGLVIEL
jgi:7,8-dihydropterin-6-yl-methyl-4-(beta-D-ribofuranosyl)aminobenzene 5'-phosphate synthase